MKSCRKSVATVLLLLIHLLTLRIGDAVAGRNDTGVKTDPKIILEKVIITRSDNGTRVITDAEDASTRIGDQLLSLLSKREIRRSRRSKQMSSNSDQEAAQSRNVIADMNEDDLERLKRVIARYEPQRITSRITKRKIVNGAHDVLHGKAAESTTDLERTYDEVLRNISRGASELTSSNIDATLNPYLSQAKKNLREIYIQQATNRLANDDDVQKSRPDVDSSYTSPILRDQKTKKLLKKYLPSNRTNTIPRSLSIEESKLNEETADNNESSTPERYYKVSNGKTKPKNELLSTESSSNIYSESTEQPESRREWNLQNSSIQTEFSSFIPQSNNNNSYNVFNVNNLDNLNYPSDTNTVQLPRYNRMPRPFSVSRSADSSVIEIPYRKPNPSSASFNRQQVARSSANVLPLILPTESLFDASSARRYVPIKRANHLKPEGDSTTLVNTEANPLTSPAGERTTYTDYRVIDTTKNPLIPVNGQRKIPSSNYYAITENPAEQIVTRTDSPRLIHIPSQTSASYTYQQEKDPQAVRRNGFLPRITVYNNPNDEKSNLNANAELALYNKFANLYSVPNVFNVPKAVTQNYQNFGQPVQSLHAVTSQYVSTPSYATSKPISPPLLKIRPSVKPALAPYYDSGLLVSQRLKEEKEFNDNKKNKENIEINESRAANADESNTEVADNENNFENHKVQINHGTYKSHKTPNEQREKEDHEEEEEDKEDRYQQPKRNYFNYQYKYDNIDNKDNKDDKNDDKREKYNVRYKDNKDEEKDADETQEDEYVNTEKSEDEHNHDYQYNKHKYDKDDSEEEDRDKQRYDNKKYNKEKNHNDEHNHETDDKLDKFVSIKKYFNSPRYSDYETREPDEKYHEHHDRKKLTHDKKDRDEDSDESFAEDKLVARRSKDERARRQREEYEKKQNKDDKSTQKRKYHHHHQATPRRGSSHEEHKHEEYGETNPKHVREKYRHLRQHVKNDDRGHDNENDNERTPDHEHGETQEHAHKHEEHHEKKKDGNHKFEEGGGSEYEDEHHGHEGEKGDKGYKVWHEHEKAEKGHHEKEHASKEYSEKDGEEKKHEEEGGYHKEHHRGEEGKKAAEFGEKGEHKKGHSTHGEHSVHKKDEYEKKTEFFDEFHEDGDVEKHGEHHHEHESKKGGHQKKSHHDAADHEEKYGKEEKHEKGGHHHEHKGHKIDEGHDHHYDHDEKYGKKEGHERGKKWSYKKGNNGDGDAGGGHNR